MINYVNQKGYGADNFWTWTLMHWNTSDTGGTVNYNLGDEPAHLHPGWAQSAYESWIIGNVLDSLTNVNPDLMDIPWGAVSWKFETFNWPPLNIVNGTKVFSFAPVMGSNNVF